MPPLLLLLLFAQDQPAFRSDVALVHVDAEVRADHQVITGLSKESFRVTDAGKPQPILYFGHQNEPLDVILLFDTWSETRSSMSRIADAARTVLSDLHSGDRIAIMASGSKLLPIADFTGDFDDAGRSLARQALQPDTKRSLQYTELLRSIAASAQLFDRQPNGNRRRAIIAVTDDQGAGTAPALVQSSLRDLWNADAVVLGVLVHSGNYVISIGPRHRGARYAASQTGGDTLETGDPAEGLREMLHRLRSRYSLYYALPPGKPGEERKIRVQLAGDAAKRYPQAIIRARTGYLSL